MKFRAPLLTCSVLSCLFATAAHADYLKIDLELKAGKATKKAKGEHAAIGVKPKERGVFEVKSGQTVTVTWTVASTAKKDKETVKDVTIHFFVVKEEKVGQTTVPKLDKDVPVESALTMDFKPKDRNDGELTFTIDTPGAYLLRLESIGAAVGKDGHEHFAALDLVVK
jgi:hypothetical protein